MVSAELNAAKSDPGPSFIRRASCVDRDKSNHFGARFNDDLTMHLRREHRFYYAPGARTSRAFTFAKSRDSEGSASSLIMLVLRAPEAFCSCPVVDASAEADATDADLDLDSGWLMGPGSGPPVSPR